MRIKLAMAFVVAVGATVPVVLTGGPLVSAGKLAPSEQLCFEVAGDPGGAALVNLTPVQSEAGGDGQLVSSDVARPPIASNVNFRPGAVDPNVAIAPIGADGEVCFVNSVHTDVHLVADHLGTVAASAYVPAKASGAPDRRVDTRSGLGGGKIKPSERRCFSVGGSPGDAAIVNLTPVLAEGAGDGQLVSSDVANPPVASNVNFRPGAVDPNVAIAKIGADGQVCFVNSVHASVHLVADHLGTIVSSAYASATASGAPDRKVDTRGGRPVSPSGQLCFPVAGDPGDAAIVNLTPILASGTGDGQLISSDSKASPPLASNVNFAAGSVDPNVAVAKIGGDGQVCYQNSSHSSVHLVADHLGIIDASVYRPATVYGAPHREVDTRNGVGLWQYSSLFATPPTKDWIEHSVVGLSTQPGGGTLVAGNLSGGETLFGKPIEPANMYVARLDKTGERVWGRSFGNGYRVLGLQGRLPGEIRAATATPDGGMIVAGEYYNVEFDGLNDLGRLVSSPGDAFVAKISATGDWEWATPGDPLSPSFSSVTDVAMTPVGGVVVAGTLGPGAQFRGTSPSPGLSDFGDTFVAELDSDGNWLGTTRFVGTRHIAVVATESEIAAAGTFSGSQATPARVGAHTLTSDGIFVTRKAQGSDWSTPLAATGGVNTTTRDIVVTNDGRLVISGLVYEATSFGSITLGSGSFQPFVASVDRSDRWSFVTALPEPAAGYADTELLVPDGEGGVLVFGRWNDGGSIPSVQQRSAAITAISRTGNVRWQRHVTGVGNAAVTAVQATAAGVVVGGRFAVYSSIHFDDFAITSTDPYNNEMSGVFVARFVAP